MGGGTYMDKALSDAEGPAADADDCSRYDEDTARRSQMRWKQYYFIKHIFVAAMLIYFPIHATIIVSGIDDMCVGVKGTVYMSAMYLSPLVLFDLLRYLCVAKIASARPAGSTTSRRRVCMDTPRWSWLAIGE